MAQRREELRAADVDRQFVAERLKGALDEGRLTLSEYDERLRDVYGAKTYGDLDEVLVDLPGFVPVEHSQLMPAAATYPTDAVRNEMSGRPLTSVPKWLVSVWTAWLVAVSVNVVIWVLVSVSTGQLVYFWPMWVAGPWGAVLVATTLSGLLNPDKQREIERRAERKERRRRERGR